MNRSTRTCMTGILCVSVFCTLANITYAGTMDDIVKNKKITVAVQSEGPPISFKDKKGERTGLMVEIMHMMAEDMEVELAIKDYKWTDLLPALESKKIDIVAADLSPTPKQFMKTLFTEPVFYNETVAFTKKEKPYQDWRDLDQRYIRISVTKKTKFADKVKAFLPRARLREVEGGVNDIVPDVLEGRTIAGVSSLVSLHPYLGEESELMLLGKPITREPLAFAVAPESVHLLLFLNNYIQLIKNDGRLQTLLDYWWFSTQWQQDH